MVINMEHWKERQFTFTDMSGTMTFRFEHLPNLKQFNFAGMQDGAEFSQDDMIKLALFILKNQNHNNPNDNHTTIPA